MSKVNYENFIKIDRISFGITRCNWHPRRTARDRVWSLVMSDIQFTPVIFCYLSGSV
jgi:hypothetical protein